MNTEKKVNINAGGAIVPPGCLAFVLSYALNHSFWWAVLHSFLGWFYLVYAVLSRGHEILPALSRLFS